MFSDILMYFYYSIINYYSILKQQIAFFNDLFRGSHFHIISLIMLNFVLKLQKYSVFNISKPLEWQANREKNQQNFSIIFSSRIFLESLCSCHFKEKEKQRQAELQEKKEIAEKKFKEWLENAKNKPRPAAKSYGYANGKLTGQFLCYVAYINMCYRSKCYASYFLLTEICVKIIFFFKLPFSGRLYYNIGCFWGNTTNLLSFSLNQIYFKGSSYKLQSDYSNINKLNFLMFLRF